MKLLLLALLLPSVFIANEEKPEISPRTRKMAAQFGKDAEAGKLNSHSYSGLDILIRLKAVPALKNAGYTEEADTLLKEWQEQYKLLYSFYVLDARHIGEHGQVSQWLKDKMILLTEKLGKELLYSLRISDIRTFNETPKVVFGCFDQVDEMEYFLHLVFDEEVSIRGLGPTASYWVSWGACQAAGGGLYCTPIAMGVEWLTKSYVFPKLNERLWTRACTDF